MTPKNSESTDLFYHSLSSPFGPVVILWSMGQGRPTIFQVLISKKGLSAKDRWSQLFPDALHGSCPEVNSLGDDVEAFLAGEDKKFSLDMLDMGRCSSFQQRVLLAEHKIPRGAVSTYQRIADQLGIPRGARAIGNALARNPFPIIIPCHRAIRSDCSLGGFQGGSEMKRTLLEMEGIRFDDKGRGLVKRFFWEDIRYNKP